jgi:hypothetical protein
MKASAVLAVAAPTASAAGRDRTVSGTNTWTVVAVDRSGNHSAPSNPATVTVVADEMLG